jgi:hypothetical protein
MLYHTLAPSLFNCFPGGDPGACRYLSQQANDTDRPLLVTGRHGRHRQVHSSRWSQKAKWEIAMIPAMAQAQSFTSRLPVIQRSMHVALAVVIGGAKLT